ncbi:hypothetical protein [Thermophilibacter sp.]
MLTDDERRDVSARLREYVPGKTDSAVGVWYGVLDICGANLYKTTRRQQLDRLADLIEPSGHECAPGECSLNVRHDNDRIDRDALLKLADGIEYRANEDIRLRGPYYGSGEMIAIANGIREALGVSE